MLVPAARRKVEIASRRDLPGSAGAFDRSNLPGEYMLRIEELAMKSAPEAAYVAFEGDRCIATGDLREVARSAKVALGRQPHASILIFDGRTSALVDVDFRGSVDDVVARIPAAEPPAADEATAVSVP